jgi:hypothetical protein
MPSRETTRVWLAAIVVAGFALRFANAETALLHDDEKTHVAADAMWLRSRLPIGEAIRFLREHPDDHSRLYPVRGVVEPWVLSKPKNTFWGHPTLSSYVTGAVFAVVPPSGPLAAVRTARLVSVAADVAALALLPGAVRALGGSTAAALAAAALYAVFPLAVSSGSIASFDPLLAPLMVLLVRVLAGAEIRFLAAGVLSGLLISTKETGLVVLAAVPLAATRSPRRARGLAVWALATFAVVALFLDPAAYARRLLAPREPGAAVRLEPLAQLLGNVRMLASPLEHFWIGWAKHGYPRAPLLAHLNVHVAPVYVAAAVAAFCAALLRRDRRLLLVLYPPILLTLAFIPPTGAVRRLQMIAPLLCAAIACELARLSRRGRIATLVAAVAIAASPLLPARPRPGGRVDLADLLFHNPAARQRSTFFNPGEGRPLVMRVPRGVAVERALWLSPGRYRVAIEASGDLRASLGGRPLSLDSGPAAVEIEDRLNVLRLVAPEGSTLRSIVLRRRPEGSR